MKEAIEVFKSDKAWNDIKNISSVLLSAGHQCYLVGGCIRDAIIGRPLKDFDIVTNAKPEEVISLFEKTVEVGAQFGVVVVVINNKPYEVATLREETGYSDSRHPDKIIYTDSVEADSKRRDFTMNAIYFCLKTETYIDPQNGFTALSNKVIETVGEAKDRFAEDSLRVLRAFRFMGQTGFCFSDLLSKALKEYDKKAFQVSSERKTSELNKLFKSEKALKALRKMKEYSFIDFFFKKNNYQSSELSFLSRWYDLLSPSLNFEDFRLKKEDQKRIQWIEDHKSFQIEGRDLFENLKILSSENFKYLQEILVFNESEKTKIELLKREYLHKGRLPEPLLKGKDFISLGYEPGNELGALIKKAYILQVTRKVTKIENLLKLVKY